MAYDGSSFYGDLICDEYDEQNNFMNPESPTGYYIYYILGHGFDMMSDMCSQFMNDFDILTADTKGLDSFWGLSYNLPRPLLNEGDKERYLTDDEYKIYLYLRNCRLITKEDLEICFNNCFRIDDNEIYFSIETNYLNVVDHIKYESLDDITSNIKKKSDDLSDEYITDFTNDDNVEKLEGLLSVIEEEELIINIPYNGYDEDFLKFLEPYISVKGNIKIKEYLI